LAEIEKLTSFPGRIPISTALEAAERMESHLQEMEGVIRFSRAGSLRRMNETVKDLNYVIATENSESVKNGLLAFPGSRLIAGGKTKVTIRFGHGGMELSADFRLVRPEVFVCALHHFTGSKAHNGRLRHLAKCRGEKIKKYGVERNNPPKLLTFPSEEAFFRHFGLPYIAPELREDGNEIDRTEELDTLIDKWDIKGDLHLHSNWSDGEDTLVAMIEEGRKRGYEYIAFTDHSRSLRIAGGLSVDRLLRQMETIRNWNEQYEDIEILCGAEVDILPDGNLDYPDRVLKELDIVIASIHSGFSQREDELMKRLASACRNPFVHIIAHPTGRIIGRRGGYPVKIGQLLRLAVETGTILELNANPNRLDPPKEFLQQAQGAGVKIAINTDAHSTKALENMEIGVAHARKAWLRKDSVINTLPLQSLLQFIHPGSVFRNRKE
jgi:PHP domain.